MLSRAIQAVYGLPHFPGQWRIAGALRSLLPGGVGLFADGGMRYYVHAASHVGHALATRQHLETDIDALIPAGPLGLVLDVGCNAGTFALPLASRTSKIVCIDADPDQIRLLDRTLKLNGIGNVETVWAAIASAGDSVTFNIADRLKDLSSRDPGMLKGRDSFTTRTVPAKRLSGFVRKYGPVDLLKIDIEGFSGDAIASLEGELSNVRTILAEPSPDMRTGERLMEAAGFKVTQPLAHRSDLQDHQRFTYLAVHGAAR